MQSKEGVFIAIEGIDGAGKGTQFELLNKRLGLAGYDVLLLDFPRYNEPSSYFVKQYLNGVYGSLEDVGPYTASLFYALDRYEAANQIRDALAQGKVVVTNRFTGSSMAHQGTKFRNADERRGFFIWLDNLEFEMLHIPRPDLNLVLRVSAEIAQTLVDKKEQREYTDRKRDIHEDDIDHLRAAAEVYDDMCQLFPRDYLRVDTVRGGKMLPPETISNLVWEKVFPFLPKPSRSRKSARASTPAAASIVDEQTYEKTNEGEQTVTDVTRDLSDIVSDTGSPVYTFLNASDSDAIAAAFVRMSQSGDDLRLLLLDEFAPGGGAAKRSVMRNAATQELTGRHLVIEQASFLLTRELEHSRMLASIEPTHRFEEKDTAGNYKFFVPENLSEVIEASYCQLLNKIFDNYATMLKQLTQYLQETSAASQNDRDEAWQASVHRRAQEALRAVVPMAAVSTVGLFASAQTFTRLIGSLGDSDLTEAAETGKRISVQLNKVTPEMFEPHKSRSSNQSKRSREGNNAIRELARQFLPGNHAADTDRKVDLVDIWPRNELYIIPDMLYEHGTLPLRTLQSMTEAWSYDQKAEVFHAYLDNRSNQNRLPGRALEKIHYAWDILCDYDSFRTLQHYHQVEDLENQELTPRYGYDVPDIIDTAGLTETFENCFDISLKLYSTLQQAGFQTEAQYAVLLGHKLRWKVTFNAREAFTMLGGQDTTFMTTNLLKLIEQMREKIAESHPLTGAAIPDVNEHESLTEATRQTDKTDPAP